MRKLYLIISLAATLEMGCGNYSDKKPSQEKVIAPVPQLQNETLEETILRIQRDLLEKYRGGVISKKEDYAGYVKSINFYHPVISGRLPQFSSLQKECDKKEIQYRHQRAFHSVLASLEPEENIQCTGTMDLLYDKVDELVYLDKRLIKCKYSNLKEKKSKIFHEIAEHYALLQRFEEAAQECYIAGDNICARAYFLQSKNSAEKVIALTPPEELLFLRDQYQQQGDLLNAGKVEWVRVNRTGAVELITQSNEYKKELELAKKAIQDENYINAFRALWVRLKVPFYQDLIEQLCDTSAPCRNQLLSYKLGDY